MAKPDRPTLPFTLHGQRRLIAGVLLVAAFLLALLIYLQWCRVRDLRAELAQPLPYTLVSDRLTVSPDPALNHVAERVGTPEATAVFTTLAQSIEMGTSVSDNLRSASELIRRQARSRAQERAQKAVVNMSFPLLLLILPGVFIVLLAPLVIQFLASR